MITIEGVRVCSELNAHTHWRVRSRRAAAQRDLVRAALAGLDRRAAIEAHVDAGVRVRLTRVMGAKGRRFDSDNLVGSMKHVRDAVAAWAGVDDGSDFWEWVVNPVQEKGREYAVRIEITPRPGAATPAGG